NPFCTGDERAEPAKHRIAGVDRRRDRASYRFPGGNCMGCGGARLGLGWRHGRAAADNRHAFATGNPGCPPNAGRSCVTCRYCGRRNGAAGDRYRWDAANHAGSFTAHHPGGSRAGSLPRPARYHRTGAAVGSLGAGALPRWRYTRRPARGLIRNAVLRGATRALRQYLGNLPANAPEATGGLVEMEMVGVGRVVVGRKYGTEYPARLVTGTVQERCLLVFTVPIAQHADPSSVG